MKRLTYVVLILAMMATPRLSFAILGAADIVHDPINYLVNLKNELNTQLAYLEEAKQTLQQAQMLQYQVQGLVYAAQNLSTNPLTLLQQITGMWTQFNGLLNNAQGITYSLAQAGAQFDAMYPALKFTGIGQEVASISAEATKMLEQIRAAAKIATQSQSQYDRLCMQQTANALALTSAQAATGNLQILQANAQLLGLTNEQLGSLQQLTAANGRMQSSMIMREVSAEERARWNAQAWMAPWPTETMAPPQSNRGPALPE